MEILVLAAGAGPGAGSRSIETATTERGRNTSARDRRGAFAKRRPCKDFSELWIGLRIRGFCERPKVFSDLPSVAEYYRFTTTRIILTSSDEFGACG